MKAIKIGSVGRSKPLIYDLGENSKRLKRHENKIKHEPGSALKFIEVLMNGEGMEKSC